MRMIHWHPRVTRAIFYRAMPEEHINTLPALARALELQHDAARCGLDWPGFGGVIDKLAEEIVELRRASDDGDVRRVQDEIGDLLFTCVNLARHAGADPAQLLHAANRKFESRFDKVKTLCRQRGLEIQRLDMTALDRLWNEAKQADD
jgi:ATP diphosphatase